jgi:hypothetical protein
MRSSRSLRANQNLQHTTPATAPARHRNAQRLHTADVLKDLQLPREIAGEPLFEGEWK